MTWFMIVRELPEDERDRVVDAALTFLRDWQDDGWLVA